MKIKLTYILAVAVAHVLAAALPWMIVVSAYQLVLVMSGTDTSHIGFSAAAAFTIVCWVSAAAYCALTPPAHLLPLGELAGEYLVLQVGLTMLLGSLFFEKFAQSAGLPEQIQMFRTTELRQLAGGVGAVVVAIQTFRIVALNRRSAELNRVFAALTDAVPPRAAKEITEHLRVTLKGGPRPDLPKAEAVIRRPPIDRE